MSLVTTLNGEHIAAILDGEDNFIAGYLFDEGIDEPVVLVTDYNGDKELDVLSLVRDRQNSVKLIVNEKKEIVQEVSYSAYGETKIMNRGQKNPNLNNIFYYTSRELEPELGIYYYRARYYDPSVGRFLSEDPIKFFSGDINLYRYVSNNPVVGVDPDGYAKICKRSIGENFVTNSVLDSVNLEIAHEQVIYEDTKGGSDGFFDDGKGNGIWGEEDPKNYEGPKTKCEKKRYDDKKMRSAVKKVKKHKRSYDVIGNNCQDVIRRTYEKEK